MIIASLPFIYNSDFFFLQTWQLNLMQDYRGFLLVMRGGVDASNRPGGEERER